ncbi:MAG: hypothetical protein J6T99_06160 [Oscillospiraceae bacterium]|nr:hypothetical protein [Oscillospiraceae bacterium]
MVSAYYVVTELINALRLGEIGTDGAVDILERLLLMLDGAELTDEEWEDLAMKLKGVKE